MLFFRGRDQGLERHVAVCDHAFVRPDSYFAIHRENHARHTLMQVGVFSLRNNIMKKGATRR